MMEMLLSEERPQKLLELQFEALQLHLIGQDMRARQEQSCMPYGSANSNFGRYQQGATGIDL